MMVGFSQKAAIAAAGSLATLAAVTTPAQAVTFFSFEVDLFEPIDGVDTVTGSFSFEETAGFVFDGVEEFDLISFDFDFLGTSFDVGSDSRVASLSGSPVVAFDVATGDILGIDFFTDSFLSGPIISFVPEDLVGDFQDSEFVFETIDGVVGGGDVAYAAVPEPAAVVGLVALGVGSLLVRKQSAA